MTIASLLHTQPLYIKGPSDPAKSSTACYNGALLYLGTFILSVAYWVVKGGQTTNTEELAPTRTNVSGYGAVTRYDDDDDDDDDMHD